MENRFSDINDVESLIYQMVGSGSMCWEPKPTGVFDSSEARDVAQEGLARLSYLIGESSE